METKVFNKTLENPPHRVLSHFPNVAYNVIGIAASQGGLRAIQTIVSTLPADFPAAIVVVQHTSANFPSYLTDILSRSTSLQVESARTGLLLRPGIIYTLVPDRHILINPDGTLLLSDSPKLNFVRPAADLLFRSLATIYKTRAISVVLTGRNSDGALGTISIKKHGGIAIAQDETTSEFFTMPKAAIATGKVDWVLPLYAIAPKLVNLVTNEVARL
ncbi:chemotaxis protein CheB [Candidatus Gracilibacteria bacterium]|nr:chemotaxis protein CheB [Candidatus Gracilibacteria bacterium]NJM86046.1 chemotaxis protein CheB [Hydrococcus sp. RU_2_2]